jgi:peptide/nickel transport system substrate-binding protein
MKKLLSLALASLMLLGLLTACSPAAPSQSASPGGDSDKPKSFVFGVYNFTKIDPADNYNGWGTIRYGVGETLFKLDDSLRVVPHLATGHSLSEDNLTWTITLREGVLFHNGNKMDGTAVKLSLERLIAAHERAASELMIESIAADGNTLSITTAQPNPTLLNALCDPYACIVDASAEDGTVDFNLYPVCTGPYIVKSFTPDVEARLEPFAQYWGGTPALDTLTIKAIPDVDTLALAMQNGEIDAAYGLSYDTLPLFSDSDGFAVTQRATARAYMLYFNLERPFMSDPVFRRAICMAVDKTSYGEILLSGAGTPTKSAFPSSLSYGNDALFEDVPDFDLEGARALLHENGYADTDGDGFLEKDGKKVTIRLITYTRAGLPQSAQALLSALIELGIDARYELYESISQALNTGDYDICAYAYVTAPTGDPFAYLSFTMGSGKGGNYGKYSNPEVDALLDKLATEFDVSKRAEYAVEIQNIALSDSSYCYMFHLNMFMVMKKGVTGLEQSPVDYYQITAQTARAA